MTATLEKLPFIPVPYHPRGAAADLWRCRAPEVLIEGPAGTGKTRAVWEKLLALADKYPGSRHLVCRKTRESMTDSVLVTFEEKVLPPEHPLKSGPRREQRHSYRLDNGSEIVVGGLDKTDRVFSAEYDTLTVFEAFEISEGSWEDLQRALRNGHMPYTQAIADTNPRQPGHWLNVRANQGRMKRLVSRHEDNPEYWDTDAGTWTDRGLSYVEGTLKRLTGFRLARLRYGKWVSADGMVFDAFDPTLHVKTREELQSLGILNEEGGRGSAVKYALAGVDWGYTNPGVIGVWACDGDGRMYLVAEVYRTHQLIGWWVEQAVALAAKWKIETFAADPAEPSNIAEFRKAHLKTIGADNDIEAGIQSVQEHLTPAGDGRPRLFIYENALASEDPDLRAAKHPCGLKEEIEAYAFEPPKEGKSAKEEPADIYNHACDAMRYAVRQRARRIVFAPSAVAFAKN